MRFFILSSLILFGAGLSPIFTYNKKNYDISSLSDKHKQAIYDSQFQAFREQKQIVEQAAVEQYIKEEAKKEKTSLEKMQKKLLEKNVSDADVKTWYKENKARLGGRPLDAGLTLNIKDYLINMAKEQKRQGILQMLRQKGLYTLKLTAPTAPLININTASFPSRGKKDAKVKLVLFADYKCPHCSEAAESVKYLSEEFSKDLNVIFIDFPLRASGVSATVAKGGVCADQNGQFWEYHHQAFEEQDSLSSSSPKEIMTKLNSKASNKDKILAKFDKCMEDPKTEAKVEHASSEGRRIGVNSTPSLYINGRKQPSYDRGALAKTIRKIIAQKS